jgi:ribosomal subunit interface protein
VDIVVKGRRAEVPERFRAHVNDKLAKLEKFAQRIIRVDVEVSKEPNPRRADQSDRVELTVHSKGPVIRAEAAAADKYAALDVATERLLARLRKVADRRRVHHGNRTPLSVAAATAPLDGFAAAAEPAQSMDVSPEAAAAVDADLAMGDMVEDTGPMVVREKTHVASPMSLDQALYEMELVGHDFYLFVEADTKMPSVVYRRRGYDYGVIHLDV